MSQEVRVDTAHAERVILTKIKLAARSGMPDGMHDMLANAEFRLRTDWMADQMIGVMKCYVWGMNEQRIKALWPRDWWQAVKERFAPAWAKRRWPVIYESIDEPQFEAVYLALNSDRISEDPGKREIPIARPA